MIRLCDCHLYFPMVTCYLTWTYILSFKHELILQKYSALFAFIIYTPVCIQSTLQLKGRQLLSGNFEDLQLWLMCSHTYSNHIYVSYARVSQAESLPVEDNSVDLITVGMALHWFDHPTFYKEVSYLKFYWHFCHFSKKRFPYTMRKKIATIE